MKIAITGASGFIGQYIASEAISRGHRVTCYGRKKPALSPAQHIPWSLGEEIDLAGQDILIHAAFQHAPGRYRGGEGDDPSGFLKANLEGTLRLFQAAKSAGIAGCIFLSTRAVFDGYPPGTLLTEELQPMPTTLYGHVKAEAESALAALSSDDFLTANIRPTGVFGIPLDGSPHKWSSIFADFRAGRHIEPRIATEVHATDLASAVLLVCGGMIDIAKENPAIAASHNLLSDGWHQSEIETSPRAEKSLSSDRPPPKSQAIKSKTHGARNIGTSRINFKNQVPPLKFADRSTHNNIHISDIILDRHDLLSLYAKAHGLTDKNLPSPHSEQGLRLLESKTALQLGWEPTGANRLREMLRLV